ncbi:hypothetical protein NUACC26_088590 [Scytonema sp. NUACC26]
MLQVWEYCPCPKLKTNTFLFKRSVEHCSGFHLNEVQIYPRSSATGCGSITLFMYCTQVKTAIFRLTKKLSDKTRNLQWMS